MKVIGAKYDVLVMFGQNVFEIKDTTKEKELELISAELSKPVGQRGILRFSNDKVTCLFDPNIAGIAVQVISKRDFEKVQQERQLAQPRVQGVPGLPGMPRRPG